MLPNSQLVRSVLLQSEFGSVPLNPVLFWRLRICKDGGKIVGKGGWRLLFDSKSCVSEANDEMVFGIEPVSEVDDRSRSLRDAWKAGLDESVRRGFVRVWELITRFWRGSCVRVEGRDEPMVGLRMRMSVVMAVREENRLSGSCVMEVASIWRLERSVRLVNEEGSAPAGMLLPPMTCKDSRPVSAPSSLGNVAGTPGNVNCRFATLPELSHVTPFQAQNWTSFTQPRDA